MNKQQTADYYKNYYKTNEIKLKKYQAEVYKK